MSESIPADVLRELADSDRKAYLEQRLFVLSPFGTFVTAALVWLVLAASFAILAFAEHLPFLISKDGSPALEPRWRVALIATLLIAAILGIQRYARVRERGDFVAFAAVLSGGTARVGKWTGLTPSGVRLGRATVLGLILGGAIVYLFSAGSPSTGIAVDPAYFAWFTAMMLLLCMLFARGVALTRKAGQLAREMIDSDLTIDLLRIDRLSVIGRSAARAALVWFTISAVTCLFFIGGGIDALTVGLLTGCAAMGIWIFVATMERVHRKIRAAKAEEIENLRAQIDALRHALHNDATAAQKLQGLLAYEARIAAAPEWPFDQTTLMRVGASALILTVPWFGQATADYLIEQLGHVAR